jgi:hypothetical protein
MQHLENVVKEVAEECRCHGIAFNLKEIDTHLIRFHLPGLGQVEFASQRPWEGSAANCQMVTGLHQLEAPNEHLLFVELNFVWTLTQQRAVFHSSPRPEKGRGVGAGQDSVYLQTILGHLS